MRITGERGVSAGAARTEREGEAAKRCGALRLKTNRDWIEVAGVFALIFVALWTQKYATVFVVAATIWILIGTFARYRASELGIGSKGFRGSAWVAACSALVAGAIVFAGALTGTLHPFPWLPRPLFHSGVYAVWALIQQFIVQSFFFVRFERLLGSGTKAVLATALLFGAVHLPNPVLLVGTAIMGLVFGEVFRRYRNIYALGVAHALLGLAIAVALPDALHHQMKVGVDYLSYPSPQ